MATVPVPTAVQPPKQVKPAKECELRVEVGPDTPLRVRLLAGTAEIYGSKLPPDIWLPVPPRSKIAIFTWHSTTINFDRFKKTYQDNYWDNY